MGSEGYLGYLKWNLLLVETLQLLQMIKFHQLPDLLPRIELNLHNHITARP